MASEDNRTATADASPLITSGRPPTTQEAVVEVVRQAILTGHLKPGDRVFQDAIADQMGVSRVPVREALNLLRAEGQLGYTPHRGYRVSALGTDEVQELGLIRGMLEGEAIRRAVELMDPALLERLEGLNQRLRAAHEAGELIEFIELNQEFHFELFRQAGLPRLLQHIEMLWKSADGYRGAVFSDDAVRLRMLDEHDALIDACRRHDATDAVATMDAHRDKATHALTLLTANRERS